MRRKSTLSFIIVLTLILVLVSCSSANISHISDTNKSDGLLEYQGSGKTAQEQGDMDNLSATSAGSGTAVINEQINQSRKVIYTSTLEIETLEFDTAVEKVKQLAEHFDGYFESSNISGGKRDGDGRYYELHSASFTVRIPVERFAEFLERKGEIGNVYKDTTKAQDVTLQYQDNESRLKSLRLQEERVLEILVKADKLSDVFEIESTLANIRYEIESLTSKQLLLSSQVEYSTAYITLYEVRNITKTQDPPQTLSDKITLRFKSTAGDIKQFGENFLIWLLGDSLLIIIWGIVITAVVLIIRRIAIKKKKPAAMCDVQQIDTETK